MSGLLPLRLCTLIAFVFLFLSQKTRLVTAAVGFSTQSLTFANVEVSNSGSVNYTPIQHTILGGEQIYGDPKEFGRKSNNKQTSITFDLISSISAHYSLRLSLTLYGHNSWTNVGQQVNDTIAIYDEHTQTLLKEVTFDDYQQSKGNDVIKVPVLIYFEHTSSSFQLKVYATKTTFSSDKQSWGISKVYDLQYSDAYCASNCESCDTSNCLFCRAGYYLNGTTCVTSCSGATYEDKETRKCEPCHISCSQCTGGLPTQCQGGCISPYLSYDSSRKTCECGKYKYSFSGNCYDCDPSCEYCMDNTKCTVCKKGYYNDYSNAFCLPCDEKCFTCTAYETCMSCNPLKYRQTTNSTCPCNTSFFPRSQSVVFNSSLTRKDYDTTEYGMCIACSSGCVECTNENNCIKCALNSQRIPKKGKCVCYDGYAENPATLKCDKSTNQALSSAATAVAGGGAALAIPSLLLGNPAFFLSMLAIIQILKYILYVDVTYPEKVSTFFALFSPADGSSLTKFVEKGTYVMRSSNGFYYHEIDGLFLRNSNQNIIVFVGLGIAYFLIKCILNIMSKPSTSATQPQNYSRLGENDQIVVTKTTRIVPSKARPFTAAEVDQIKLSRILARERGIHPDEAARRTKKAILEAPQEIAEEDKTMTMKVKGYMQDIMTAFEWGVFLGTIEAAFLNLCTFSFLSIQNSSASNGLQKFSFIFGFITVSFLLLFMYVIYQIVMKILRSNKLITLISSETNEKSVIVPLQTVKTTGQIQAKEVKEMEDIGAQKEFLKSFQMVYSLFVPGQILQQGFYLVVIVRKFIFAFILVFAYKVPALVLTVWIILNFSMIGILLYYKPYKEFIFTMRDILTEFCFSIIHFVTYPLCSSDFMDDASNNDTYENIGTVIIIFICLIILIQLICIIYDSVQALRAYLKKRKEKKSNSVTPVVPGTPILSPVPERVKEYDDPELTNVKLSVYQKLRNQNSVESNNSVLASAIRSGSGMRGSGSSGIRNVNNNNQDPEGLLGSGRNMNQEIQNSNKIKRFLVNHQENMESKTISREAKTNINQIKEKITESESVDEVVKLQSDYKNVIFFDNVAASLKSFLLSNPAASENEAQKSMPPVQFVDPNLAQKQKQEQQQAEDQQKAIELQKAQQEQQKKREQEQLTLSQQQQKKIELQKAQQEQQKKREQEQLLLSQQQQKQEELQKQKAQQQQEQSLKEQQLKAQALLAKQESQPSQLKQQPDQQMQQSQQENQSQQKPKSLSELQQMNLNSRQLPRFDDERQNPIIQVQKDPKGEQSKYLQMKQSRTANALTNNKNENSNGGDSSELSSYNSGKPTQQLLLSVNHPQQKDQMQQKPPPRLQSRNEDPFSEQTIDVTDTLDHHNQSSAKKQYLLDNSFNNNELSSRNQNNNSFNYLNVDALNQSIGEQSSMAETPLESYKLSDLSRMANKKKKFVSPFNNKNEKTFENTNEHISFD